MNISTSLTSIVYAYVKITSSVIIAHLVQLGTLVITHGHQQNLTLNPGKYSVDPDQNEFNASISKKCRYWYNRMAFESLK